MKKEGFRKYKEIILFLVVVFIFLIGFFVSEKVVRRAPADLIAVPGGPYYGNSGWVVGLDGSGSTGDIVSYTWQYFDGITWIDIPGCFESICDFDTTGLDYTGSIQINLIVADSGGDTDKTSTSLYDYCDVGLDESLTLFNVLDCADKTFNLIGSGIILDCVMHSIIGDVSVEGDFVEVGGCNVDGDVFVSAEDCLLQASSFDGSLTFDDANGCVAQDIDVTGDLLLNGGLDDLSVELISSTIFGVIDVQYGLLNVKQYIDISVVDKDEGTPLKGVVVEVEDQDGVVIDYETDEDGKISDSLINYIVDVDGVVDYSYILTAVYGDQEYSYNDGESFDIIDDMVVEITDAFSELECLEDEGCDSGEICEDYICMAGCRIDDDCDSGYVCESNECVEEIVTGGGDECEDDDDCGDLEICEDEECVEVECTDDSDCDDLEACLDNECEEVECVSDDDCSSDEECASNECVLITECTDDSDCGDLEVCDYYECVVVECVSDSDCSLDEECVSNSCVAVAEEDESIGTETDEEDESLETDEEDVNATDVSVEDVDFESALYSVIVVVVLGILFFGYKLWWLKRKDAKIIGRRKF